MSLPFIVGVAGHRQVLQETTVVQEVEAFLKEISQHALVTAQAGQLFIASSLAEGADRLVAHTALQLGWRLIVVLPFPQARFEQDFPNSVNEFRTLLQQAEIIIIADADLVSDHDLGLGSGAPQDAGYERVAVYVAQHVNVLLVLWDGMSYDGGRGGTAHSVLMRRTAQASMGSMRLAEECLGPVYHIHVPRQQGVRLQPQWLDSDPGVRPFPLAVNHFLTQIESFNASAAKFRGHPSADWRKAAEQLQLNVTSEVRLVTTFADASMHSNDSQSNFRRRLIGSIVVLGVGGFGKELLNNFEC